MLYKMEKKLKCLLLFTLLFIGVGQTHAARIDY